MKMYDLLGSETLKLPYDSGTEGAKEILEKKFTDFKTELDHFYKKNPSIGMKSTRKNVTKSMNSILDAIDNYLSGDITNACEIFNKTAEKMKPSIIKMSRFYRKYMFYTYYRARVRSKDTEIFDKKEEFFHIAFESRYLVKNQRYSISGFPCLYLGATPYVCYEELGRPKEEDMYFVKMEIPRNYRLATIGLLPYEFQAHLRKQNATGNQKIIREYLKMLPLIMACSIQVPAARKEGTFKEEYIIPQLFTQWLVTSGRNFDGILYFSTAAPTHSRKNDRLYQNLVIPVKETAHKGYCRKLSKEIRLTSPVWAGKVKFWDEIYDSAADMSDLPAHGRVCKDSKSEIHYSSSGFKQIEHELSLKECSLME